MIRSNIRVALDNLDGATGIDPRVIERLRAAAEDRCADPVRCRACPVRCAEPLGTTPRPARSWAR